MSLRQTASSQDGIDPQQGLDQFAIVRRRQSGRQDSGLFPSCRWWRRQRLEIVIGRFLTTARAIGRQA
jgi:hypothetical protein